jgi:hypothetical protein
MISQLQLYGFYSASYLDTNSSTYTSTIKDSGLLIDALAADLLVVSASRLSNFVQGLFKGQDTSPGKIYTLQTASADFTRGIIAVFPINDDKHIAMDFSSSYIYMKDYINANLPTMAAGAKTKVVQELEFAAYIIQEVVINNAGADELEEFGSLITSTSHDFSYAGSGVNFLGLPANQGGVGKTDLDIRVYEEDGGRVYQTSGDETGDFFAGPGFIIRQATGTIEGRSFDKATAARIVPLNIALETY